MHQLKYRYNPTTCRYEPVSVQPKNIIGSILLYLSLTGVLATALLFLHSAVFTTETERALIQENNVLKAHHKELKHELKTVQASLLNLEKAEGVVHEKLARNLEQPDLADQLAVNYEPPQVDDFKKEIKKTKDESINLLTKARYTNFVLASNLNIDKKSLELLMNIPAFQPVENKELTKLVSGFGSRIHPFHGATYFHQGVDFVAPRGTPVYASASGIVSLINFSDLQMGNGNVIEIDHGNGYKTRYHHLDKINVKQGQTIAKGSVIGTVGMTGGAVSPHLHFEVLKNNKHVNPIDYLFEGLTSTEYEALRVLANQKNQALD